MDSADLHHKLLPNVTVRRKVFVSYHHKDRPWIEEFRQTFNIAFDIYDAHSPGHLINSADKEYVLRTIREQYITGTSITVVMCGAETMNRKWVDWEICSTLNKDHALLGILLPTAHDQRFVPDRLQANVSCGYASLIGWTTDLRDIRFAVEQAVFRSSMNRKFKDNRLPTMTRNRSL